MSLDYDVVVPTTGRPELASLLPALAAGDGPLPRRVLLVDDRPDHRAPLIADRHLGPLISRVCVLPGPARGPAAARNAGWRASRADWVAFLDDDVIPPPGWRAELARDLRGLPADVAASQGRVRVPLPRHRSPTDWERNVAGLRDARWATADMAYRRDVLAAVGGFDERFPRAYREDADLGLRVVRTGRRIALGDRRVLHPVRPAPAGVSLAKQAGNADDALMRVLHGRRWRERAGIPAGRRPRHLLTAGVGLAALGAAAAGRRRAAAAMVAAWAAGTAELAWARIAPGPRTPREVATMLWTSAAMPFAASAWWLYGTAEASWRARSAAGPRTRPEAILFDRDGTLIADVPYNGDPGRVEPMPGAREALERVRAAGVRIGVVSNQSGIVRGLLRPDDVERVNARVDALLGPLGPIEVCPHGPDDGCGCRKPKPGMVLRAATRLGVDPARCAVVGDIGADVEAAEAAGARGVLVPTARTRREEVEAAAEVAPDLRAAVALLLGDPEPAAAPAAAASREPDVASPRETSVPAHHEAAA